MKETKIRLDASVERESTAVLDEIVSYLEAQNESRTLNPRFYTDVLLFLSELLPHLEDPGKWIDLGYMICRDIKQNLERYGYLNAGAMFGGLGTQCFAVKQFCTRANILHDFSRSLNALLLVAAETKIKELQGNDTYDAMYDVISGISGIVYYLLDCEHTQEEKQVLLRCIEFLLDFTRDTEYCGQTVVKFHILQPNQGQHFDQEDYKDGSINFSLAHGMLGPLLAMAKADAKGFVVDGLREGIHKIYHLYETFATENEAGVPYWPGLITVDEYTQKACKPEHFHLTSSWCYGNVGILRGLQLVCGYMNWTEKKQHYTEVLQQFYTQDVETYFLNRPSLCHGFASVLVVQTSAYYDNHDPLMLANIEGNIRALIASYRNSNEQEADLEEIHNRTNDVEGYLADLTFLTGSLGVATALLSLKGKIASAKLLMLE